MAGSEPKRSLEDLSGLGSPPGSQQRTGSRNPVEWLKNGRMPSLWVLARLLFALGVLTAVGEVLAGLAMLYGSLFLTSVSYTEFGFRSQFWAGSMASVFMFTFTTALFLFAAAVTAYLAARNDREASQFHAPQDPPPAP